MRPRVDCITARQLVQDDVEQDVAENIVHRHPFPFAFSQNYCANLLDLPISFLLNLLLHIYIYYVRVFVDHQQVSFFYLQANAAVVFKCAWPGCLEIKTTVALIEEHVRQSHLG